MAAARRARRRSGFGSSWRPGRAVTPPTAAGVRNLVRLMDWLFSRYCQILPGFLMVLLHRRHQRPGDLVAGTIVVRDRPSDWSLGPAPATPDEPLEGPAQPELFRRRVPAAGPVPRPGGRARARRPGAHGDGPGASLPGARPPPRPRPPAPTSQRCTPMKQRKRRGRFATRAQAGAIGRTTVTAERFVAHSVRLGGLSGPRRRVS